MMKRLLPLCVAVMLLCTSALFAQKHTSFSPGEIWTDNNGTHINAHGGGFIYHDNTYYWFGEHKIEGGAGNKAHVGVCCYSSKDLYNWTDEGVALAVSDDPNSDVTKECVLERPKVIYNKKTKRFVMWFHLELKDKGYSEALSGIAVAKKITGPYTFVRSTRSNPGKYPVNVQDCHKGPVRQHKEGTPWHPDSVNLIGRDLVRGQMQRDMQLFVDDDGKAYHIFASEENCTLHIAELTDDYLGHSGKYVRAFVNRSMEAPAIFKKDGLYYFMGSGCTGWDPNAARSAVAPSIWGPWTELGNPCVGQDAHLTFYSQSTYILPVAGKKDAFIYIGDRWAPQNAIDGRYIWLPIRFEDNKFKVDWKDNWMLEVFDNK